MKTKIQDIYKEIENKVQGIEKEFIPFTEKINNLFLEYKNTTEEKEPLQSLCRCLTTTSRRHDINQILKIDEQNYKVGTNHNGIGYLQDYDSQLNPLCLQENGYYSRERYPKILREILLNEDILTELTPILKKQNQITFLKMVNIVKKYQLKEGFNKFLKKSNEIKINLNDFKIEGLIGNVFLEISKNTHNLVFRIFFDKTYSSLDTQLVFSMDTKTFQRQKDDYDKNELIVGSKYKISLDNLKILSFILDNKDFIIEKIKSEYGNKIELYNEYVNEREEINELLNPILALEKI